MDEKIRAILDARAMPCDFWLYRLQEICSIGSEISKRAEELRPLIKHFEAAGVRFPKALPQPDLEVTGYRSVRAQLGRLKLGVSAAWETLSPEDKTKAKQLHRLCAEIRAMSGQDDRPEVCND